MKILVVGDSWGCGVWEYSKKSNIKPFIIHKGIEQFMIDDGHEVTNLSVGGTSNKSNIRRMKMLDNLNYYDYIFFIKTDPLRNMLSSVKYKTNTKWFEDYESLLLMNYNFMLDDYKELNNFNTPIYIIGGCYKVNIELLKQFNNLKLVLSSIPEFLESKFKAPEIFFSGSWKNDLDDKWDLETLDRLIEQQDIWEWLNKNSNHFKKDRYHPDIDAYKKVYNYIKENILIDR